MGATVELNSGLYHIVIQYNGMDNPLRGCAFTDWQSVVCAFALFVLGAFVQSAWTGVCTKNAEHRDTERETERESETLETSLSNQGNQSSPGTRVHERVGRTSESLLSRGTRARDRSGRPSEISVQTTVTDRDQGASDRLRLQPRPAKPATMAICQNFCPRGLEESVVAAFLKAQCDDYGADYALLWRHRGKDSGELVVGGGYVTPAYRNESHASGKSCTFAEDSVGVVLTCGSAVARSYQSSNTILISVKSCDYFVRREMAVKHGIKSICFARGVHGIVVEYGSRSASWKGAAKRATTTLAKGATTTSGCYHHPDASVWKRHGASIGQPQANVEYEQRESYLHRRSTEIPMAFEEGDRSTQWSSFAKSHFPTGYAQHANRIDNSGRGYLKNADCQCPEYCPKHLEQIQRPSKKCQGKEGYRTHSENLDHLSSDMPCPSASSDVAREKSTDVSASKPSARGNDRANRDTTRWAPNAAFQQHPRQSQPKNKNHLCELPGPLIMRTSASITRSASFSSMSSTLSSASLDVDAGGANAFSLSKEVRTAFTRRSGSAMHLNSSFSVLTSSLLDAERVGKTPTRKGLIGGEKRERGENGSGEGAGGRGGVITLSRDVHTAPAGRRRSGSAMSLNASSGTSSSRLLDAECAGSGTLTRKGPLGGEQGERTERGEGRSGETAGGRGGANTLSQYVRTTRGGMRRSGSAMSLSTSFGAPSSSSPDTERASAKEGALGTPTRKEVLKNAPKSSGARFYADVVNRAQSTHRVSRSGSV